MYMIDGKGNFLPERKFAINGSGNLKVQLSKPSHTPNR
jgi:hypothetical protein